MNLAYRDIRRQLPRFVATALGLGLLYAIVLAMGGIYRGMVDDAIMLIDRTGADLWVVQRDTRGPFAERSVVTRSLSLRAEAVPGVTWAHPYTTFTIQRERAGRPLRATLVGLDWPDDRGADLPLVEGRALAAGHREIIVDRALGLSLDETLSLGDDDYRVVGVVKGVVSSGGDPVAFLTNTDALRIQDYLPPEAVRLTRAASGSDISTQSGAGVPPLVSAVLVRVGPDADREAVRRHLAAWPDVSVFTTGEQRELLLGGVVDKARRQIGLFRVLLAIVSSIIVSLVVFNMTVAKTREIALLKLMGARLRVIVSMIVQQALLLGGLGFGFAVLVAQLAFDRFPRRVVVGPEEYAGVFALVVVIALVSSAAAVRRALSIPPTTILAG